MKQPYRIEGVALRLAVALGGLVPVGAGLAGMVLGTHLVGEAGSVDLDSHVRYLSGLLLGIGLGFWSTIPRIEAQRARFGLLTVIVVLGGLGRLLGMGLQGLPSISMRLAEVMELVVTPALFVWQRRISRQDRPGR